MVKMLKNAINNDGFLGALHALLLMDDTVLLATNRDMCINKFKVVTQYCEEFGMSINAKKTKFFVMNAVENDKNPIVVNNIKVCYSPKYLYLGGWFTDSGKMTDVVALHEKANQATVNKFSIFCAVNSNMPFKYKRMVFDAAVTASLLYSAESWLTDNIKVIEQQYNQLVRCLLGVRKNTSIDLCLMESGISPLRYVLSKRRCTFLKSKLSCNDIEQPLINFYRLCQENNTPDYRFLSRSLEYDVECNPHLSIVNSIRGKAINGTKFNTYICDLNQALVTRPMYLTNTFILDYLRESVSRVRLMSHNLTSWPFGPG